MNADHLLDAFGLIDDRFIISENKPRVIPWRKRLTVLIAALLILAMCIGTAMAVSEEFRSFIFSIFQVETQDQPPASEATHPRSPGLHEMGIVNIDGEVNAWYFSSGGFLAVCDGGFYTSEWMEAGTAPDNPAFWEITFDGAREVQNTRVDFPFIHGGKTFQILFDYALLNGKLAIQVWPEGLDENPVGNGWNVEPLGTRTDVALLTIPTLSGNDYTHDLFQLDLETMDVTPLITGAPVLADAYWITEDLRYAVIAGCDPESYEFSYCLYDMKTAAITHLGDHVEFAWFLNDNTVAIREEAENGKINLIRYHIPTGVRNVLLDDISSSDYRPIRNHWAEGSYGLLYRDDGTATLMDFHTREMLELTGLDTENLTCDESPDGSRIMLAYEDANGFTKLGILDTATGVLKLLNREVSGGSESFRGWLDNDTLVITAHDIPNAEMEFTPGDGYYVYVYRFLKPETEPLSPAVTEPGQTIPSEPEDDAFVRVKDYIPDIVVDLRYATTNNFTGAVIYDFTEPWLRYGTVKKLMQVQEELKQNGLYLKIWDSFRPTSAQFRLWGVCPDSRYVANPTKGFSSHSCGGTVDVTLVYADGSKVKMPTGYDDFSTLADRDYSDCDPEATADAKFLEDLMIKHGFKPYWGEWWHYTDTEAYPAEESFQP